MTRSIKLGHCVCDPRKPCPCPLYKDRNICTCAGERETPVTRSESAIRLTDHVRSAGCASKIGQKDLHQVLNMLPRVHDPRLIVGMATADDAGVFQLNENTIIVQTVDVFTPGVNDPYTFGRIAACNSLSDVYAMGGRPVTALSIIGFPIYSLPHEAMAEIIKGGMDVLSEAGTVLLGGHSINDEEVKFGFAVTGIVERKNLMTNAGARPGDVIVLTKPLGTGIVSLADQIGRAAPESLAALAASMSTLNRTAAEIMVEYGAHACTDVTGFGLMGHLAQVVRESRVTARIETSALPLLPLVENYAKDGIFSGANERNAEYTESVSEIQPDIPEHMKAVLFDAQTSGGLLIFFPREAAEPALAAMKQQGLQAASIIGEVTEESSGKIIVCQSAAGAPPAPAVNDIHSRKEEEMPMDDKCCTHDAPTGNIDDPIQAFKNFISASLQPGTVDVVTKELIAFALSLAVQCEPCTKTHIRKAMEMGISKKELEETAAIAIAFGGCKTLMLWMAAKKEMN